MLLLIKIKSGDIDILGDIKKQIFKEEFEKYDFNSKDIINIQWDKKINNNNIYYTIKNTDKIVAGINIFKETRKDEYLCTLFIDRKLNNKFLNRKTVKKVERFHNNWVKWILKNPSKNDKWYNFYEGFSYRYIKEILPPSKKEEFSLKLYEKAV